MSLSEKIQLASELYTRCTDTDVVATRHIKDFIKGLKERINGIASHSDNCRCPVKMNEYAGKQILNDIDELAGEKFK